MAKNGTCRPSRYALEAAELLASLVRINRIRAGMTVEELSMHAGVSRGLVQRIESGRLGCGLGAVFRVAAVAGVSLFPVPPGRGFHGDAHDRATLSILPDPGGVTRPSRDFNDDF